VALEPLWLFSVILMTAAGATGSAAAERSLDPPKWVTQHPRCGVVKLATVKNPSGEVGVPSGGYNVHQLRIVRSIGVTCRKARRLAHQDWRTGAAGTFRWKTLRTWSTTSGGSGFALERRGRGHGRSVTYVAVH
jgi:hypothetical protein